MATGQVLGGIVAIGSGGFETPLAPPLVFVGLMLGFLGGAAFLLVGGRADPRSADLAGIFAAVASTFAMSPMLSAADASLGLFPRIAPVVVGLRIEALLPYFLWRFARSFPRKHGADPFDVVTRRMIVFTGAVGVGLLLVPLASYLLDPTPQFFARLDRFGSASAYWPIIGLSALPALLVMVLRSRLVELAERRRVRILIFSAALGGSPILFFSMLDALGLLQDPRMIRVAAWLAYPGLLAIPFLTVYAVLVDKALGVRLIIRRGLQYALARYTLIAAGLFPLLLMMGFVYQNRAQPVAALFGGSEALILLALSLLAFAALRVRERLEDSLDRRFFRQQYDAKRILRTLVEQAREAASPQALGRALAHQIDKALQPETVIVLGADEGDGWLVPLGGVGSPLSTEGPALAELRTSASLVDVEKWSRAGIDTQESRWLEDNRIRMMAPLMGRGGELLGVIGLGGKRSELPYTAEDRELLRDVASASAVTLENVGMRLLDTRGQADGSEGSPTPQQPAWECQTCHAIQPEHADACRVCGGRGAPALVPPVVAGKFRMVRRLGKGAAGVVYLAEDATLGRHVAVKTLPALSPTQAARLRREARALAAVSHPHLALIYGTESWADVPMLVLEFLAGGTLSAALADGPLPVDEALEIAGKLADAVAHMHDKGMLHRDIKPSNIGFTQDGVPKLMDFGLVQLTAAVWGDTPPGQIPVGPTHLSLSGPMPGTVSYMSPEALSGEPPAPREDIWSLSVVTYEMIAGERPWKARTLPTAIAQVLNVEAPPLQDHGQETPARLGELLADCLAGDPRRRPASAAAFRDALREIG